MDLSGSIQVKRGWFGWFKIARSSRWLPSWSTSMDAYDTRLAVKYFTAEVLLIKDGGTCQT